MRLTSFSIAKFNIGWAGHRPGKHPPRPPAHPLGGQENNLLASFFWKVVFVGIFSQASAQGHLRVLSFEHLHNAPWTHFNRPWWWIMIQAKKQYRTDVPCNRVRYSVVWHGMSSLLYDIQAGTSLHTNGVGTFHLSGGHHLSSEIENRAYRRTLRRYLFFILYQFRYVIHGSSAPMSSHGDAVEVMRCTNCSSSRELQENMSNSHIQFE